MRVRIQTRLQTMLRNAKQTEREIDARQPLTPEWGRVLRNVRAAGAELDEAVRFLKENQPR